MVPQNILPDPSSEKDCPHTLRIDSLCAICGAELPSDHSLVPILHLSDRLFQVPTKAYELQKLRNRQLRKKNRMILILDLDQTILHASPTEIDCDFKFAIGPAVFYVKLRPHLPEFLETAAGLFEIHVYTMGTREYASEICRRIDPEGRYFGERIVSRSENLNEMKKTIGRITCISENVVILDDRADVWEYSKNLVMIRPFWYKNRIDINDPKAGGSGEMRVGSGWMKEVSSEGVEKTKEEGQTAIIGPGSGVGQALVPGSGGYSVPGSDGYSAPSPPIQPVQPPVPALSPNDVPENTRRTVEMAGPADKELLMALKTLKKVHRKYFRDRKPVEKLLRLRQMKNIRIGTRRDCIPMILFTGAVLDMDQPTFVVEDAALAVEKKTKNVSLRWVYECLYRRKVIPIEGFVISDHSEEDEYTLRLKTEFF